MIALGSPLPPGRPAARPPPDSRAADDHVRVSSQFSRQYCGCAAQYAGNGTAAARAASRYWRCSANWAASSSGGRSTLAWWAVAGQSAWCPRRRRGNWRDCCTGCSMPRMCPGLQPPARLTTALPNTPPHSETAGRMPPAGMLTPGDSPTQAKPAPAPGIPVFQRPGEWPSGAWRAPGACPTAGGRRVGVAVACLKPWPLAPGVGGTR